MRAGEDLSEIEIINCQEIVFIEQQASQFG